MINVSVAKRVLGRKHVIKGANVRVTTIDSPPSGPPPILPKPARVASTLSTENAESGENKGKSFLWQVTIAQSKV